MQIQSRSLYGSHVFTTFLDPVLGVTMKQVCWHSRRSEAHRGLPEARSRIRTVSTPKVSSSRPDWRHDDGLEFIYSDLNEYLGGERIRANPPRDRLDLPAVPEEGEESSGGIDDLPAEGDDMMKTWK